MLRKLLFVTVVVVLLLGGARALYGYRMTAVLVEKPKQGLAVEAVYATGVVEPVIQAKVAPLAAARVLKILKRDGDVVGVGEPLVLLDQREAAGNLEQQEARRDYLKDEIRRQQVLVEKGFVSQAALSKLAFDLKQADASLQSARRPLAETVLRSPLRGIVLRQEGEAGEMVTAGQGLFWVGDPKSMRVTADVDEEDILRVRPGQKALIKADGLPGQVVQAVVGEITEKGDSLNKSYRVRLVLPADAPLKTGMTVEVNIVITERPQALLVPTSSLRGERLWTVDNLASPVARLLPVKTGVRGQEQTEILEGISPDQSVISVPPAQLVDGQSIRLR